MPTYEYHCQACDHRFDELQSFSEPELKKCPQCGKNKLKRAFGIGAAVLFKGSGFYQTDYRSASYQNAAKADQQAQSASGSKSDSNGSSGAAKSEAAGKGGKGAKDS